MRTTTHLVRRSAYAAALALLVTGVAGVPALAAGTSPTPPQRRRRRRPFRRVDRDLGHRRSHRRGLTRAQQRGRRLRLHRDRHGGLPDRGTDPEQPAGGRAVRPGSGNIRQRPDPGRGALVAAAGGSDQGAAYVFTDTSGTWTQIAELTVPGTAELGTSLALSTDASTIVLGSPTSNNDNGEAFVFTKSGSTYVQTQELTEPATAATAARVLTRAGSAATAAKKPKPAPAPSVPAFLGDNTAISSDGSTIAFGEPNVGVTDVFTKAAGAATWTQTAQLHGGDSVAVSSNGEIVAAGQAGINNLNGAVFVFTESGGTFAEASEVLPPANTTKAAFAAGSNIGMSASGSTIAFGAPTATAGSAFEPGEVFVATQTSAGTWALTGTDTEPTPASDDDLGGDDQSVSVAGNGTAIIAGARAANGETGQAIVFPAS